LTDNTALKEAVVGWLILLTGLTAVGLVFVYWPISLPLGAGGALLYWHKNSAALRTQRASRTTAQLTKQIKALTVAYPDAETFADELLKELFQSRRSIPPTSVRARLRYVAEDLYSTENFASPALIDPPASWDAVEHARHQEELAHTYQKLADRAAYDAFRGVLLEAFKAFLDGLPPAALLPKTQAEYGVLFSLPLMQSLPKPGALVENLILEFFSTEARNLNLFANLREQLDANHHSASGVAHDPKFTSKLIAPVDYTGNNLIEDYLHHTPLEVLFSAEVPFTFPEERWFEGTWIVAAQGRGKTNLLRHLILERLKEPCCVIIMDAKASGDLVRSFDELSMLADRLVLLNPGVEHPLAINPLDIGSHSSEFLEYIFSALLESKMTPNQSTLFRMVLRLCVLIPNATLDTFREILQIGWKPYDTFVRQLPKREQDFFDHQFSAKGYTERRPEVVARLYTLMTNPVLDAIFQATKTKLDMFELINQPNVICIENNEETLGEQGAEFFGRLMVSLVWAASRRRGQMREEDKLPVYFFIDEAHYTIARDPKVAAIIEQCRAQKIAMIFSHQRVVHIKDEDVLGALNNCAIKLANTTGEAHELAPRLQTTADFIKAQKRGQFAAYVVDATDTAVSLSVPLVDMSQYKRMSRSETDLLMALIRAGLRPPSSRPEGRRQQLGRELETPQASILLRPADPRQ
jgi:hypothetical protein